MIVHDMENADDIGGKYKPRIGLYDKKKELNTKSDEDYFLQWIWYIENKKNI